MGKLKPIISRLAMFGSRVLRGLMRPPQFSSAYALDAGIAFVTIAALAVVAYALVFSWLDRQILPEEPVDEVRYLDQGWEKAVDSQDREAFYYTPQGSYVKDLRYEWFIHLERPWSSAKFSAPSAMRSYGFIVDPIRTQSNPDQLPVGFARRYDASSGENFLDLTCAACHTGQLNIVSGHRRVAVRIDGGQAFHDITSSRPGGFGTDLLASLIATYINPFKFTRFAHQVLGPGYNTEALAHLRANLGGVIVIVARQAAIDAWRHLYPVEEGFGRTDAIGRISNTVFATHMDPANYRVGNAPVSFPPLWDIWKFDWVQYTGSVRQPMARNLGESLGTGARFYFFDAYGRKTAPGDRYRSSTDLVNLKKIEDDLRKLTPPQWPEDLFGAVDRKLAAEGRGLFLQLCQPCHGPHPTDKYATGWVSPGKVNPNGASLPNWKMTLLPAEDIGTDPTAAINFFRNRLDLRLSGLTAAEVRDNIRPIYEKDYDRQMAYLRDKIGQLTASKNSNELPRYQSQLSKLEAQGRRDYVGEKLNAVDLSSASLGSGLNYIVTMIRSKTYQDLGLDDKQQQDFDGFGSLDTPSVEAQYKARPLAGVWATAPYLHNGSVPTLYDLLLPVSRRPKTFYIRSRYFDTRKVGLVDEPAIPGSFKYDTSIPGNFNTGHEFRAGYVPWREGAPPSHGVIGPELTDHQRMAIIEYLKIHKDDSADAAPATYAPPSWPNQQACANCDSYRPAAPVPPSTK